MSNGRIMLVEDERIVALHLQQQLAKFDYEVVGNVASGERALQVVEEHRPDLILMDIQLPEISGLEVTKWLKDDEELRDIPVIAVTAFAMKGDEERIRQGGCEAYISKPISIGTFLETVRRYLGEK